MDLPARGAFSRIFQDAQIPLIDVGFLDPLKQRRIEVVGAVEGFDVGHVLLKGGRRLAVDVVIAATGFSRALEPLVGHLGVLRDNGQPAVNADKTASGAPGLYFCGYRNFPGGLLRQIRRDAEEIALTIAGRSLGDRGSGA